MARRMFEFRCEAHGVFEGLVDPEVRSLACPTCAAVAPRIISTPRIALDGVSGHFPTAWDAWGRKMQEAHRKADQRHYEHTGETY